MSDYLWLYKLSLSFKKGEMLRIETRNSWSELSYSIKQTNKISVILDTYANKQL